MSHRFYSSRALWPLWWAALILTTFLAALAGQPTVVRAEATEGDTLYWPGVYLPFVTAQQEETAAPVILSTPALTATVGVSYTYLVEAGGLPTPTLSLLDGPPDMTLDATSGLLEWMPADEGVYTVTVQAANGINPDAVQSFAVEVSAAPLPARVWDARLDLRGATLVEAAVTPGQGYWRLVEAHWYNTAESQGRVHIFVDTLDRNGNRQTGVPIRFSWSGGFATAYTSAKPGELYAADFPMCNLAPAYSAEPGDGAPADRVDGMGLGEIDSPDYAHHTSYRLIWRWTIAPR